ncbi:DNase I-like protein, partial [Bimuria novae-zelandiae CBS 107.79]
GKVYGVCSIIREDLVQNLNAQVRTVDWDKEGRVSVVELKTASTKFALFNIYAVNGTDNPYRDPATGAVRGTRHDRKLAFHRLLMEECLSLENNGWKVLLAGDMNVAPARIDGHPRLRTSPQQHVVNRADFDTKFLREKNQAEVNVFNGVDVWRKSHKEEARYTYFPGSRGLGSSCDRVDYAIAGRSMRDRGMVTGSGILDSEAERGPSDHVPIWIEISMDTSNEKKKNSIDGQEPERAPIGYATAIVKGYTGHIKL